MRSSWPLLAFLISLFCLSTTSAEKTEFGERDRGPIVLSGLVLVPGQSEDTAVPPGYMPLKGASVVIEGTEYRTETNANGQFVFRDGPKGQVWVMITKEGYRPQKHWVELVAGAVTPATLLVELLPQGASVEEGGLTGPGTLYVAFAQRVKPARREEPGGLMNLLKALSAGADPLDVEARHTEAEDPRNANWSPLYTNPNFVMSRPQKAPARSGFRNFDLPPIWPCFDGQGRYLYVAMAGKTIQVLDVSQHNEQVRNLPVQQEGIVTSMVRANRGALIAATVMSAKIPGVMMLNTKSQLPEAYLTIDNSTHMIPTAVAFAPDDTRLYVTLTNGLNRNAEGRLVAIDPYTGQTLAEMTVGASPTDVKLSEDGRFAFVVNSASGTLEVVDVTAWTSVTKTPVGAEPLKLALIPGARLMVTNRKSDSVSVLEQSGRLLGKAIRVGDAPLAIAVSPDGSTAYVSNSEDGTLSIIDTKTRRVKYTTGAMPRANPYGLAIRP